MENRPLPQPSSSPTVILQPVGPSGFSRWFSWLGWMAFFLCLPVLLGMAVAYRDYFNTDEGIQERFHSLSTTAADKVAVIKAVGVLAESEGFVKHQIQRVLDDPNVKAVVLRVDSPGGTVSASDYLYHQLLKLRQEREIPLVVSMGGMAASGGYYIAMAVGDQEDAIFAEPTTTTGSIGVIIPHYDISGFLQRHDIRDDSIVSHPRKQLLSMTHTASPEDRAVLQDYVDQAFTRFKSIVQAGRPKFQEDPQALDVLATGEIFAAERAAEVGLVDRIGFLDDAVQRAMELAGLTEATTRVVTFEQPPSIWDAVAAARLEVLAHRHQPVVSRFEQHLLELSVPRAHYLFTSLPGYAP